MKADLKTTEGCDFLDPFYSPHTKWKRIEKNFYQLPHKYSFDLKEMQAECDKIVQQFPLEPFKFTTQEGKERSRLSYRGVGLSSRSGSDNALYDSLSIYSKEGNKLNIYQSFANMSDKKPSVERQVANIFEADFDQTTEACTPYFKNLLSKFKSPFSKVRLLELHPGGIIPAHFDFPYYQTIRIHAVIKSNPDVIWEVEGEQMSIPADGHFYWFDTGKYHAVKNMSQETRLVLSINLLVYHDRAGQQIRSENENLIDIFDSGAL